MSAFIGQELLYDYLNGQLDEERRIAVESFLRDSKEAQSNLQKIRNGLSYTDKLSQTQVSDALFEKVISPSKYSEVLLQKVRFNQWSPALKLGIEATIVAFGITVFAILIPWYKLMDLRFGPNEIVLTEVGRDHTAKVSAGTDTLTQDELTFPDEGAQAPAAVATVVKNTEEKVQTQTSTTTTSTTIAVASSTAGETPAKSETQASAAAPSVAEKRQGELYRGQIEVTNVTAISPKLVERMQALGARKAGRVELGWSKDGNSSYFHFTMPSSRYEELLALFGEFGSLTIKKEKHDRVMPEGIVRIIITMDEKK